MVVKVGGGLEALAEGGYEAEVMGLDWGDAPEMWESWSKGMV